VGPVVAAEGVGLVAVAAESADFAVGLLDWWAESSGLTAAAYSTIIYKENSKSTQTCMIKKA
jgi:hypothetical protein